MIELNAILEDAISRLDISPTDFELARLRYKAVGKWLENGDYSSGDSVEIYLQGSFRLGTVIRPYRNKTDADYDIDQVCEINGEDPSAVELKIDVGNRLKEHSDYSRMLDKEGKRCWTLIYAADSNRPGFHLDVLPARNSRILGLGNKIKITNLGDSNYVWRESNPRGYYEWFKDRNGSLDDFAYSQRKGIFQKNASLYASVEEVPKELVRTPLQRAIQLMKRHRDVSFDRKEGSPISIIITTICAHRYQGRDIDDTIQRFLKYVKDRLEAVVSGEDPEEDGIMNYTNGKWNIPNPTNENENFADRWEADPDRAKAFFAWVYQLGRDYHGFSKSSNPIELRTAARGLSSEAPTASKALIIGLEQKGISSSDDFLALIHSAIDLKTSWEDVKRIAWQNVQQESGASDKDIAYINYYQALRHKGDGLNAEQTEHIKRILDRRGSTPAFVLCCNLLLGSASQNMLKQSLRSGWASNDILSWPILRLYKGQIPENSRITLPYFD
jgi:hypothetical protein